MAPAVLAAAARRARRLGVGADEVLVASGAVTAQAAARLIAASLGLATADLDAMPMPQGPLAKAALRTGVIMAPQPGGRTHFTWAVAGRQVRRLARALKADPSLAQRVRLAAPADLARRITQSSGDGLCAGAAFDLARAAPEVSAATLRPARLLAACGLACGVPAALALALAPDAAVLAFQAAFSLVFLSWITLRLAGCLYDSPADPEPDPDARGLPLYSILVPLYREAASVPRLIRALSTLDYPPEKLDIKLVVEADDAETRAAIAACRPPPWFAQVAVPAIGPRTKPKALNMALPFARGQFVAVFDAEDAPEPDQLRRALAAFRTGGAGIACVQARLAADNGAESWISGHFAAEYAAQFDVLLPMLSALGLPVLLGGTSNHFRRDVLERVGAWDPYNVTEDADLGVRLARAGWGTLVIASATHEEAPVRLSAWLGQRTRWLKGWAQTLLVHGRRPAALVRDLGLASTLALFLLTAGPYAAALLHPMFVAVLIRDLLQGAVGAPCDTPAQVAASALSYTTLIAGYGGAALCSAVGLARRGLPARASTLASIPAYWLLLSVAAWRALWELVRRPHFWCKTEHGLSRRRARLRSSASAPPPPLPEAAWH
ncbi:glycosyltransferase [Xanthobacter sp. KR7-225]|uniref:glycosyltransferase n=1 Tax=Xanthobacter sp. KR7-225 TaxID=3156613 RepID=UPI0032B61DF2